MSKFVLENGKPVNYKDKKWPQRLVWYGVCTYWTDNWDKLDSQFSGIPCCPICKAFGFQITFEKWLQGAKKYEDEGNKWYCKFLIDHIEYCSTQRINNQTMSPATWNELYTDWKIQRGIT